MIIISNEQLRKHLGTGVISAAEDSDRILAYVAFGQEVVRKAVGVEILLQFTDSTYNQAFFDALEETEFELFNRIEKAVAFYTYLSYLPFSLGSEGDKGLQETKTDKTAPVRMGVYDGRLNATANNAALALENLLEYLFEHRADFPAWTGSDAYKETVGLFISSGKELGRAFPSTGGHYRMFVAIKGFLAEAQEYVATPILGLGLMADIKAKRIAGTLSELEQELVQKTAKVVAVCGYLEAMPNLVIVATEQGALRIYSEFDGINNKKSPSMEQLEMLKRSIESRVLQMKAELVIFLNAHAADFPLFMLSESYAPEEFKQPSFLDSKEYTRLFTL